MNPSRSSGWIEMPIVTLPYKPRFPQTLIHPNLETHRFSVLVAHRRLGKTVLAINHMIKMCMKNYKPHGRYAYMAPYKNQAKLIAWDYIKRYTYPIPGTRFNEVELYAELPNRARIYVFGADNPDAIRGTYLDGIVLDEYAQIKPEVFGEIVRPALSDRNGWCVFTGTPKGQNQFYELYQRAMKLMAEGDPDWWVGLYRADETNVITENELGQMKAVLSEATYRQEMLCDFTAAADNVLITIDTITAAASKKHSMGDVYGAPVILGVDVARFGDDRSVIMRRQGIQAFEPLVFSKIDNMTLVGAIGIEVEKYKPDAIFVDAGRGEGVIDRLRQLGHRVQEINFGGTPNVPAAYNNKRTEMWVQMAEWFRQGGAIPNHPDLKSDLVVPTYDYDPSNKMRLESKDKIKERLGKSPDIADALALTFALPVFKKDPIMAGLRARERKEYNPLG